MNKPKYYIVEASALPEVFVKVAEAKRLLSTGEAATVNDIVLGFVHTILLRNEKVHLSVYGKHLHRYCSTPF